jgi:hypothetical protein
MRNVQRFRRYCACAADIAACAREAPDEAVAIEKAAVEFKVAATG